MTDLAELFIAMLEKLDGIQESLIEISGKLDNIDGVYGLDDIHTAIDDVSSKLENVNGVYGLDDIHTAIDDVSSKITGPLNYNLEDIYNELGK
jgi:hypothetical protein